MQQTTTATTTLTKTIAPTTTAKTTTTTLSTTTRCAVHSHPRLLSSFNLLICFINEDDGTQEGVFIISGRQIRDQVHLYGMRFVNTTA